MMRLGSSEKHPWKLFKRFTANAIVLVNQYSSLSCTRKICIMYVFFLLWHTNNNSTHARTLLVLRPKICRSIMLNTCTFTTKKTINYFGSNKKNLQNASIPFCSYFSNGSKLSLSFSIFHWFNMCEISNYVFTLSNQILHRLRSFSS